MPAEWAGWPVLVRWQCTISKIPFPLLLYTFIEQNIFFPETCFAYPISEPKFTVWDILSDEPAGRKTPSGRYCKQKNYSIFHLWFRPKKLKHNSFLCYLINKKMWYHDDKSTYQFQLDQGSFWVDWTWKKM